ncbi:hypothetical protein D4R86_05620 [bacterium]|nr:MAG: hypothetical protein D4R86_05620 [bacterium]
MKKKKNNNFYIDLSKKILKKIKKDKLKMRSKFYFISGSLLLSFGIAASLMFSIFLISIISFRIRTQGHFNFLRFGGPGYHMFLFNFPWSILLLAIIGIVGGLTLIKKFDISYKKPYALTIAFSILLVLLFGILVDNLGFNKRISGLKPMKPFYGDEDVQAPIVAGKVLEIKSQSIEILTPDQEKLTLRITAELITRDFFIKEGQDIAAIGSWQKDEFIVRALIPLEKGYRGFPAHFPRAPK